MLAVDRRGGDLSDDDNLPGTLDMAAAAEAIAAAAGAAGAGAAPDNYSSTDTEADVVERDQIRSAPTTPKKAVPPVDTVSAVSRGGAGGAAAGSVPNRSRQRFKHSAIVCSALPGESVVVLVLLVVHRQTSSTVEVRLCDNIAAFVCAFVWYFRPLCCSFCLPASAFADWAAGCSGTQIV